MSQSSSIVKQASILALAGILVRVIGVLYRSPLKAMIGAEGVGYYSTAYTIYAMILLLSSYSIPTAISKLISEKLALHQYNNAQKILKCAFIYICVIGGGAALVTFFIAPFIVKENAVIALRVLCPTIFLSGILGVLRGYFQAHQTTLYTSVSQIIEQIFNAIVSVLAAYLFIQPYLEIGGSEMAKWGAAGSALGTGAGVLIGLAFMCFMFICKRNKMIEKEDEDLYEDSVQTIYKTILNIVTPIIIATCVYNLISTIDMYFFYWAMELKGLDNVAAVTNWGLYSGEYIVLQNVPVALASAMSTASIPAIASNYATKNITKVKELIRSGVRTTMLILIPASVGMGVLSYGIIYLMFPQNVETSSLLLTLGAPAIALYGLSTLTNGILQAIGEVKVPLKNATISLITHCILITLLLTLTPLGVYALVIGNCTYALQVCVLNQIALQKTLHYKQERRRTFILPIIASLIMGIIVYGLYQGIQYILHRNIIALGVSIIVGVIVYFVVILFIYSGHLEELNSIPYMHKITSRLSRKTAE